MKIIIEAEKSELRNSSRILQFWYRATQGFVPGSVLRQAEDLESIDGIKTTIAFSPKYMDDVVALVEKFGIELVSIIRGGMSIAMGVKGLVSAKFKKELNDLTNKNKPTVSSETKKNEPAAKESALMCDKYAA